VFTKEEKRSSKNLGSWERGKGGMVSNCGNSEASKLGGCYLAKLGGRRNGKATEKNGNNQFKTKRGQEPTIEVGTVPKICRRECD